MWKQYKVWNLKQFEDYSDYIDDLYDVFETHGTNPMVLRDCLVWLVGTIVWWKYIFKGFAWIIKKIGGRHE